MEIDISKHIVDLLHENDVVSLPGLGSFVGSYKSAAVDQVSGTVVPPAKNITFDDNLRMDDGLLVDAIGKTHGITFDTASALVEDYVQKIREVLERREIVSFPSLGRLYRDFEQNLQFLPDATNFNVESHGLPEIKVYPVAQPEAILDPEPVMVENPGSRSSASAAVPLGSLITHWMKDNVLILGILATAAVVLLLFTLLKGPLDRSTSREDTQVNVPPPVSEEDYSNDFPAEEIPKEQRQPLTSDKEGAIVDNNDAALNDKKNSTPSKPSTTTKVPNTTSTVPPKVTVKPADPAPTTAVADKNGIIAIGSFKDQANVAKLVQQISAAGLTPYQAASGALTRVGVQFKYSTPAELNSMLALVRKKFEPGAVVIQR